METSESLRAKDLATRWGLKVRHALYRKTGNWYHQLTGFPGALLDADGYVIFESEQEFRECPQLQVKSKSVRQRESKLSLATFMCLSQTADQTARWSSLSFVRGCPQGDKGGEVRLKVES